MGFQPFCNGQRRYMMVEDCDLTTVKVDQGSLGHPTTKLTTLLTDIEEIKGVDGWKMQGQPEKWPQEFEKRIQFSEELATWVTGLKELLRMAIQRLSQEETMVQALALKEQKEIMEWKEHFRADRLPFCQGCEVCLRAAGADRHRKRLQSAQHPSVCQWILWDHLPKERTRS